MGRNIGIVDDEKLVLFGIQSLLSEDDSPFAVTGTWQNARDALLHCLKSPPDLLLTDIGMPGMDGLELIRRLKQQKVPTKVVVLSCHDEFDLVHEAFLLGAEDYLLKKDIDKERILDILIRLLPDESDPLKVDPDESCDYRTLISQHLRHGSLLGVMGFKKAYDNHGSEIQWQPDAMMVQQVIRDVLAADDLCILDDQHRLVMILTPPDLPLQEGHADPRLERVRSSVSRYLNRKVYISQLANDTGRTPAELHAGALKGLDDMFYVPESSVLCAEERESVPSGSYILPLAVSGNTDSWRDVTGNFFSRVEERKPDPTSVKAECVFAVKHLLYHLEEHGIADTRDIVPDSSRDFPSVLNGFDDLSHLVEWLLSFLTLLYQRIDEKRQEHRPLPEIRSHIAQSLDDDLRLSQVAEIFSLNPNYLSALFKKETGLSYIEYVNQKRIQLARELLLSTDLSAKEISFKCGYHNPNYFSRVFKSVVGSTISEFRRGHAL